MINATLSPSAKIGAALAALTGRNGPAPYFRTILSLTVSKIETRAIPTLAVTHDWRMLYNPDFVAETSVDELLWVCFHEAFHLRSEHHKRAAQLGLVAPEGGVPPDSRLVRLFKLANLAQDASINEQIVAIPGAKLPGQFVLPHTLPEFGPFRPQPVNLPWEARYKMLLEDDQNTPQDKQPQPGDGQGDQNGDGQGGHSPGEGAVGSGSCGSCSAGGTPTKAGDAGKGRSKVEIDRALRETARAIHDHVKAKGAGSVPADLVRWADEYLEEAAIDWRDYLSAACTHAIHSRPGAVDLTYRRVSRRQGGVGFGVGRPILSGMHQPIPRVGVIVDTSGSMGLADLRDAVSEIKGVLDEVQAKITVVGVDAQAGEPVEAATIEEAVKALTGGGGTDMTPGFDFLATRPERPEIIICLTDGHFYCAVPDRFGFAKTIWVVVSDTPGNLGGAQWGEAIVLNELKPRKAA